MICLISEHVLMYRLPDKSINRLIGIVQRIITMYQLPINLFITGHHFLDQLVDIRPTRYYCIVLVLLFAPGLMVTTEDERLRES